MYVTRWPYLSLRTWRVIKIRTKQCKNVVVIRMEENCLLRGITITLLHRHITCFYITILYNVQCSHTFLSCKIRYLPNNIIIYRVVQQASWSPPYFPLIMNLFLSWFLNTHKYTLFKFLKLLVLFKTFPPFYLSIVNYYLLSG